MSRFFIGILLGTGAILPGISSGVICVILGMYDKLINSVLGLFKDFKKNSYYLFPIVLGGVIGIFLVGNILKLLFNNFPTQTSYCFIGLILGSIPLLIKKINSEHTFKLYYLIFTILSFILGYLLVLIENKINFSGSIDNYSYMFLILSGFLMSIGVVIPGISNTLILMCIGIYPTYINAISRLNIGILFLMGIGLILGSLFFILIVKILLKHFYMPTYYSIIGFTLGSVLVLYSPINFNLHGFICICLLILGLLIANRLENMT